jgi:hypothetical protein
LKAVEKGLGEEVRESNGRGCMDQSKVDSEQGHTEQALGTLT